MHERNIEACSRNRPCLGKTISITYPKCVFIALVIQHPKRVRHIILSCDLSGSTIFFYVTSEKARFLEKFVEHEVYFDFFKN